MKPGGHVHFSTEVTASEAAIGSMAGSITSSAESRTTSFNLHWESNVGLFSLVSRDLSFLVYAFEFKGDV